MVLSTSASPKRVGVCWITVTGTSMALILVESMPASLVATTVALLSCRSWLRMKLMVVSFWRLMETLWSEYPIYDAVSSWAPFGKVRV